MLVDGVSTTTTTRACEGRRRRKQTLRWLLASPFARFARALRGPTGRSSRRGAGYLRTQLTIFFSSLANTTRSTRSPDFLFHKGVGEFDWS